MSLFTPKTTALSSYFAKAKYTMAWRITIFFGISCLILAPLSISNILVAGIFSTLSILSFVLLFILRITKKYTPLFWTYVLIGTFVVHYSINAIPNYTHFVDFLWMMVVILLAFISLGKKVGFVFSFLNLVGIIMFYLFSLNNHITTIEPLSQLKIIAAISEIVICLLSITYLINEYVKFNNYYSTELRLSNELLSKRNNENVLLVKEIHHRVKNNLQIVISLLRLQKGELKSDEAKRHFNEAINRIMVMSLIHKKLYQKVDMANIEIQPYIDDLATDVIHISNMGYPITSEANSEIEKIGLKTIVPLGLLINELLSNSIKHAFKKDGYISISILKGRNENEFILVYADDGKWIKPLDENTSFGLGLIQTLTEQLDGSYTRQQSEYTFELKNLDH